MVTLSEIINQTSSNYFIQDNNAFLDLLAYFLRADCQCISLSCLYRNDKIDKIVIKTNSSKNKDLKEVYENILKIIEYIKNLLKNSGLELRTIYKDFIDKIMKYKFLQDPDFKKLPKEKGNNTDDDKNNLSQVAPENWQDNDNKDERSNLIKLRWEVFLKIIDDCKNVKFSMENIDNLFYLDANGEGVRTLNEELIHSELLVMDIMYEYYKNINFEGYYYIGSNFKNCPCCAILIDILNDNNKIKIETNGCHLKYYGSWPFPPIMSPDNDGYDLLKKFFERLTLTSYNDSDNDDEVQFQNENRKYDALKDQIEYIISEKASKSLNKDVIESTIDWNDIFQKRMNYLNNKKENMSLQGKVVYVAGGSGIVGWGIAEAFLKAGAKVYISSRDQKKLDNIKKKLPENLKERLVGIKGSASDEKDIVAIKDAILAQDKMIDHVVSAIGGWWQKGTLSNQSMQEFNSSITTLVVSHFLVYRTFSKELAKQSRSTYTFVTGGAGELYQKDDFVMLQDASLMFVGGGATYGLYNAAKAEYHTHPNLNINQLRIFVWVRPQEDCTFDPEIATNEVGHDYIGRYAVRIAEKHHAGLVRVKPRDQQNEDDYKKI